MEREDRAIRLYAKLLQRRTCKGRVRPQSAEQQREERERIAMAREERHTRLCLKRRRALPRQTDEAITKPTAGSSTASQIAQRQVTPTASSLPTASLMEPRVNSKIKKTAKAAHRRKLRDPRASSPPPPSREQRERRDEGTDNQQDVAAAAGTWQARIKARLMVPIGDDDENEDGVDYGNEFEDMVDELHLAVH